MENKSIVSIKSMLLEPKFFLKMRHVNERFVNLASTGGTAGLFFKHKN